MKASDTGEGGLTTKAMPPPMATTATTPTTAPTMAPVLEPPPPSLEPSVVGAEPSVALSVLPLGLPSAGAEPSVGAGAGTKGAPRVALTEPGTTVMPAGESRV